MAPGPLLATFWAGSILAHTLASGEAGGARDVNNACEAAGSRVKGLADGSLSASVVLGRPLMGEQGADGSVILSGTTEPVLSGFEADFVVVPVELDGAESWWVAPRSTFGSTALEPLDPTRSMASLVFEGTALAADACLAGVDRRAVDGIVAVLAAAEGAGIASWCVDTAAAYAAERRQFGRPIGQFQAVKHRCADMLVATEAARAVTWDAANAIDAARKEPPELEAALLAATDRCSGDPGCHGAGSRGCDTGARRYRVHMGTRRPSASATGRFIAPDPRGIGTSPSGCGERSADRGAPSPPG